MSRCSAGTPPARTREGFEERRFKLTHTRLHPNRAESERGHSGLVTHQHVGIPRATEPVRELLGRARAVTVAVGFGLAHKRRNVAAAGLQVQIVKSFPVVTSLLRTHQIERGGMLREGEAMYGQCTTVRRRWTGSAAGGGGAGYGVRIGRSMAAIEEGDSRDVEVQGGDQDSCSRCGRRRYHNPVTLTAQACICVIWTWVSLARVGMQGGEVGRRG